ncbi:MAG: 2-hydroxyacid dehydrogenase [Spirochaetaceae bacterium]
MKVVVTRKLPFDVRDYFSDVELFYNDSDKPIDREVLKRELADAEGLVPLLADPVDRELLENAPKLRVIGNYAVGYNNIDLEAARERNISVCNTPHVLTEATAELGFALIMAVARRIPDADRYTRETGYVAWTPTLYLGKELAGSTVGIFGMGRIGQALGKRARGFDMRVIYHKRSRDRHAELMLPAEYRDFDRMLEEADTVVVTAPLTAETRHRFTIDEFRRMKRDAIFVNIGRGPIVKEEDLVTALTEGEIFGAGIDVYEFEPEITRGLVSLSNAVVLPHVGSATFHARREMARLACSAVRSVLLEGETPPNTIV